jgi:hypothetical protein
MRETVIYSEDGETQLETIGGIRIIVVVACEFTPEGLETRVLGVPGVAYPPGYGPPFIRDDSGGETNHAGLLRR